MSGPLVPGDVIGGRYEIEEYIDEGGMQFVYKAQDQLAGRLVALKTPKNRSAVKRFLRSAIVAAKVNHPNVAKTLDYVDDGSVQYLIEELIDGTDLSKALLARAAFIDSALAAKVFHHLAKGIRAAHHAGVVHRDLKPSNVMVAGGHSLDEIKVTDFGVAKMAAEEINSVVQGGLANTTSSTAVGHIPYMSPETINTPTQVGPPSDVWSLGAMMWHLLCGEPPYGVGYRAVARIVTAMPPVASAFVTANPQFAALSTRLLDLALRCMAPDPAARPTADEVTLQCGEFCYPSAPRLEGIVKRVDHGSWGFITTFEGDVFFNMASVYGPSRPAVGDVVGFSAYPGGGAPRAHPVVVFTA